MTPRPSPNILPWLHLSHASANKWIELEGVAGTEEGEHERPEPVTRDKEEKTLRDALLRRRLSEIAELAEADPLYGVSREEAMKRAAKKVAEKYGQPAREKEGGKKPHFFPWGVRL